MIDTIVHPLAINDAAGRNLPDDHGSRFSRPNGIFNLTLWRVPTHSAWYGPTAALSRTGCRVFSWRVPPQAGATERDCTYEAGTGLPRHLKFIYRLIRHNRECQRREAPRDPTIASAHSRSYRPVAS